jgi:hypothetical protein
MKNRPTLTVVVFLFLCAVTITAMTAAVYAAATDGVPELASAPAATASSNPHDQENAARAAHIRFEPLLLLLLGSTLFSIGTAIKLVLSRTLDNNSVQQPPRRKTTRPGLAG